MTDQEIFNAMASVLGHYFRAHPEIGSIKLRCYTEDEGLLHDLSFSPPKFREAVDHEIEQLYAEQAAKNSEQSDP